MNVDRTPDGPPGPAVWEQPPMRAALARRDMATVYRRLQASGIAQRRIATLTGQSPSEVYEILNGRQVMAYDVLARIADGLGVPRGYLGLAYDESTTAVLGTAITGAGAVTASVSVSAQERAEVRQLLAHAANVTVGANADDIATWWQPVDLTRTPAPETVNQSDVTQMEAATTVMRTLDYRHGGGACRDAVAAQVRRAQLLLTAPCPEDVRPRLHLALADLHNLAGWTSFDVGLYSPARRHFARALELAQHVGVASLVANILYRMGRLHLHRGFYRDALKFFQLGQIAAQDAGNELTVAMLCANEAWAYAMLGDRVQAVSSIGRARDEFGRAEAATAPAWVRFFTVADLHAMTGVVYATLPGRDPGYLDHAVDQLVTGLDLRDTGAERSRTFELTALAAAHLAAGSQHSGLELGHTAVDHAAMLRSVRTVDRLATLRTEAARLGGNRDARELVERIATLQAV